MEDNKEGEESSTKEIPNPENVESEDRKVDYSLYYLLPEMSLLRTQL